MKDFLLKILRWVSRHLNKKSPRSSYIIISLISFVVFVLSMNGFVELTDELYENQLGPADKLISQFVQSYRTETLTGFMHIITDLGDRWAYLTVGGVVIIGLLIAKKSKWLILQLTVVILLASGSSLVLKRVIERERPVGEHLVEVSTLSYPSGHSMSAIAFYGFMIYLFFRLFRSKTIQVSLSAVFFLLILLIGTSRIYLGVHYPSDVAAGFLGGLIWLTFCIIVYNLISMYRIKELKEPEEEI